MRTILLWIITTGLVSSSCGKIKAGSVISSVSSGAPFLTASEIIAGSNLNSPSKTDLLTALEGNNYVYNNHPSDTASPCDAVINAIPVQATASTVTIAASVDLSACMTQLFASKGTTVTHAEGSFQIYLQIDCPSSDLSSFNGATFGSTQTGDTKPDEICTTGTEILETLTEFSGSFQASSTAFQMTIHDSSFAGTGDLTPCNIASTGRNGKFTIGNSCISTHKTSSTSVVQGKTTAAEDFIKFTFADVSDDNNTTAVWHTSGTIGVTYDSWTGTLTYTNAATPPTYKMTPATGSAISGSLTAAKLTASLITPNTQLQDSSHILMTSFNPVAFPNRYRVRQLDR